jgi:hypothetical protein
MGKVTVLVWFVLAMCIGAPVAHGQDLWGYYPINQNDFKDYSGSGHDGTPADGAAVVADREQGWVASFVQEPNKPSRVSLGTIDPAAGGQLTVSVWAYWQGGNGKPQGIAGKSSSAEDRSWVLQLRDSDGKIEWGGAVPILSNVALAQGQWQHVVGTCDGTTFKIFLNGQNVGEGPGHFGPGAKQANVTLGCAEDQSAVRASFNGLLDEVVIFSRAATLDQVQLLAAGTVPSFGNARNPIPANAALDVLPTTTLSWTAGDGAAFHNVYFGTYPEPNQLVVPQGTTTVYTPAAALEPGTTYYWRVDEVEADGVTVHAGNVWCFSTQSPLAYNPSPADGANDASTAPTLTWVPGQGATQHHVYLSTSESAVTQGDKAADKGLVTEPMYKPGELQATKIYYWRVDEVISATEVRTGTMWSFRTCVPVDDFEKYDTLQGTSVFDTWVDGYTNKTSGSVVGYEETTTWTYCETQIVHGGQQSMPFEYNNVGPFYYSEAEQEFPAAQGGDTYDVDTLVLWVRGQVTNSPAPLYIALKDVHGMVGRIPYPDPNVVTSTQWTEWRIFMPQFMMTGLDLSAIKKIMIGVGDPQSTTPGGKGLIFIDDIHAIKTMTFDPSMMMP